MTCRQYLTDGYSVRIHAERQDRIDTGSSSNDEILKPLLRNKTDMLAGRIADQICVNRAAREVASDASRDTQRPRDYGQPSSRNYSPE